MASRGLSSVCGIEFAEPDEPVVRRAARYDTVIVVGEEYVLVDRVEAYSLFGVEARLYPLPAAETPTLMSVLGLLGWLWERVENGRRVLVEGSGGQGVVAAACLVAKGVHPAEALRMVREAGMDVYSPLQLRLLALLDALVSSGVDAGEEAARFRSVAFTGGDAHTASVAEHALEHALRLRGLLPVSPATVYRAVVEPWRAPRLNDYEETVVAVARSLDATLVGAVRSTFLEIGESRLTVNVGCTLLMREDECWPEASAADPYYRRLAGYLGLKGVEYHMMDPEEVACRAYWFLDEEMCGEGGGGEEAGDGY